MKRHMRDNYYIVGEGTVYCLLLFAFEGRKDSLAPLG